MGLIEKSLQRAFDQAAAQLTTPVSPADIKRLIAHLRKVSKTGQNGWAYAMRAHFNKKQIPDHAQLLNELSSQAADDAGVMAKIVGLDATILLLRFYNQTAKP